VFIFDLIKTERGDKEREGGVKKQTGDKEREGGG
jgi:hypothetical protein